MSIKKKKYAKFLSEFTKLNISCYFTKKKVIYLFEKKTSLKFDLSFYNCIYHFNPKISKFLAPSFCSFRKWVWKFGSFIQRLFFNICWCFKGCIVYTNTLTYFKKKTLTIYKLKGMFQFIIWYVSIFLVHPFLHQSEITCP